MPRRKIIELSWTGLYDRGWGKNLVPAAYQHPAKVSFLLSEKIFDFMFEQGWLREGQTVLDPFFGIGGFALAGMRHGCHMIGVELEPKFVALANENIALWNSRYQGKLPRWGTARVVQGDSRRLRDVIAGANALTASPPYANQAIEKNSKSIDRHKQYETYRAQGGGASFDAFCATQELHSQGYGTTPGQLAALRKSELRDALVSSPPYAGARVGDECGAANVGHGANYGATDGQLGAMPEGVISSPPYAGALSAEKSGIDWTKGKDGRDFTKEPGQEVRKHMGLGYGSSPAQLGAMKEGNVEWILVKSAGSQSAGEADGVNRAPISTSAKFSRDGKSRRDSGRRSRQRTLVDLPQNVGENPIPIGKAEWDDAGAALDGQSPNAKRENATGISASGVDQPSDCRSTTSGRKTKPGDNGTIPSATLKHFVPVATLEHHAPGSKQQESAKSAGVLSRQISPDNGIAPMLAEGNHNEQQTQDSENGDEPITFWQASKIIVEQCFAALAPGAHTAWVCKRFVRDKKIVEFSQQWAQLCESCGFEIVAWARAWQTKDDGTQLGIDGNHKRLYKKKVGFFRRLHEKKYPETAIDWEDVIFMVKPKRENGKG